MSSLRFPIIQPKKSSEQQEYNFINKDKKKKTSTNLSNPLQMIEELKHKIQDQKKEIDNRNITIQGLQRNFQSLSVIVKNQKANSAQLRAELDGLRGNAENGDKRATEMHEKLINAQNQNKSLKEELKILKKNHSECQQFVIISEELKKRLNECEQTNQKLHSKIMNLDTEKKILQIELNKTKAFQKDRRILNERIIDLEDEIKKLTDQNNNILFKNGLMNEQVATIKNQLAKSQKKTQDMKMKLKQSQKRKSSLESQIEFLQRQNAKMQHQIEESNKVMSNKDLFSKVKQEQEERAKKELKIMSQQLSNLKHSYDQLCKDSNEKSDMLSFSHKEIELLREQNVKNMQNWKKKEQKYISEMEKLSSALKDLHQKLDYATGESNSLSRKLVEQSSKNEGYKEKVGSLLSNIEQMNSKMEEHQKKYAHYFKLIAKNQPNVIITNEREMSKLENTSISTLSQYKSQIAQLQAVIQNQEKNLDFEQKNTENMKKYIKNLEKEVETKSREVIEKNRLLRKYEDQEDKLAKVLEEERRLAEKIKKESEYEIERALRELEDAKIKSQRQIEEERAKMEEELNEERRLNEQKMKKEKQRAEQYNRIIENYKKEEEDLKRMMGKEQEEMQKSAKQKEDQINRLIKEKETEIEKERKNNKLLWSDNKKLKDMELKLKEEAEKLLEEKEAAKREEIQRLRRQIQRKYKEEMDALKVEDTNSGELKKILNEKANQMKLLTENSNKMKSEIQFYKNRNKQLQGVVSRIEKQYKDKMSDLQRENKSNKQVIDVLDKKMKEAEAKLDETEKKQKKELKMLYEELDDLKSKHKSLKIEQKIALVGKTVIDLETSLKALLNTLSCTYCVEVVKDCVRMDCGHIFCRKCKAGYQPNCGECKKKGNVSNDKLIDQTVTKGIYMNILLKTIKEDINKISL